MNLFESSKQTLALKKYDKAAAKTTLAASHTISNGGHPVKNCIATIEKMGLGGQGSCD
jgi:hypothetical protein